LLRRQISAAKQLRAKHEVEGGSTKKELKRIRKPGSQEELAYCEGGK
jgi:hypothetical protein